MTRCTLCFGLMSEAELLNIDDCSQSLENGLEILKLHFSFFDKILNLSKLICPFCWSQLSSFHVFYNQVASNHQITSKTLAIFNEVPAITLENINIKTEQEFEMDFEDFDSENVKIEAKEEEKSSKSMKDHQKSQKNQEKSPKRSIKSEKITKSQILTSNPDSNRLKSKKNLQKIQKNPTKNKKEPKPKINDPEREQKIFSDNEKIKETVDIKCDICKLELDSFPQVRKHFKKVHKISGYLICCGRKYTKKLRLLEHLNSHYNITFECDECGKSFFTKDILKRHKICHETKKMFECDKCPKTFATKFQVRNHLHNVHLNENKELSFICPQSNCNKGFVNQTRLDHHIKYTHSGGDQIICEVCSRTFAKRCYLDDHMRIHLRDKGLKNDRFKCHICEHFITGEREFKRHLKNHETEAWDNICNYCEKRCKSLKTLKKHIYFMHQMEAKHQCNFCGKSFKRPRDLMDHESIHTEQHNYTCEFCSKTFRMHTNYTSHRKKEHPDLYQLPSYMREDA